MSFGAPLVLLALLAVPLLGWFYVVEQRRRERVATAFVSAAMLPSVAPRRPGWRRHVPIAAFALAIAVLIAAAAKPRRGVSVPVADGAVMLANDVSSSMAATDVAPSRLGAAQRADQRFLATVPRLVRVGLLQFNGVPAVLQSPTTDRAPTLAALSQLTAKGHTNIGNAIDAAAGSITRLRSPSRKRIPGAIVLLSDGTSTGGVDAIGAARQAAAQHVPVYTVALGTARGVISVRHRGRRSSVPVPLDPIELQQIARASGARSYTVGDAGNLSDVYAHLAATLGHRRVEHALSASFAGVSLLLLLAGAGVSLRWFGRLV